MTNSTSNLSWDAHITSLDNYTEPSEALSDVIKNGVLHINPSLSDTGYYWSNFTLPLSQKFNGDDFKFEVQVKNPESSGGINAYDVSLSFASSEVATNGAGASFMGKFWAADYTGISALGAGKNGFDSMVVSLSDWHTLGIETKDQKVTTYYDGKQVGQYTYTGKIGEIDSLSINTKGSGSVDWAKATSNGALILEDNFDSTTAHLVDTENLSWDAHITSLDNYTEPSEALSDVIKNGVLHINPSLSGTGYYWSNFTLPLSQKFNGDDFKFEVRVKNPESSGGLNAYDVSLSFASSEVATNGAGASFMGASWAADYTGISALGTGKNGFDSMVVSLSDWHTLGIETKNQQVTTYYDGKQVGQYTYTGKIGEIDSLSINTKGSGSVDWAKATSNGALIFEDNFDSTTAHLTTTAVTEPTNHAPTGDVIITGNTVKGQTLTASNTLADTDGLGTMGYQWQVNNVNIGTGNSYTLTGNEIGKTVTVVASYTDGLGHAESVSSEPTSAVTAPVIAATAGFIINPVIVQNTGEDGTTANYSIALKTAPLAGQNVALSFTSSDANEGVIDNPTLTFTSSNYATPQTLTVRGVDDYLDDGLVPYQVTVKVDTIDIFYKDLIISPLSLTNADDGLDIVLDLYGDEGSSKKDIIKGGNGTDTLHGLNMADNLSGGLGNDTLYGGYGGDNLFGNEGDDKLLGEQENDYLDGGTGNDTLDGGDGVDTMIGGAGNDTYILGYDAVDKIDDQGLSTDIDTVIMPYQITSYTLPTGIENGKISEGTQASNLTGNDSDNALTGNDGKNKLIGAVGRDSLFGGLGDDVLNGGTGNDILEGGTGKDNLTGGAGKDNFLFDTAIKANVDKITDFKPIDDSITLENQIFTKLTTAGVLNSANFVTGAAHDSNDYLVYNKATGALFYDADGSGSGAGIQIATIGVNLTLTAADFVVI